MKIIYALLPLSLFAAVAATVAAPREIQDKTLVAWLAPANLTQRGGSALTLDDQHGHFDGIVFGELAPATWMAGSDFYRRTKKPQPDCAAETAGPDTLVQVALVYRGSEVTLYRNGREYARHRIGEPQRFGAGSAVVIGLRHLEAHDRACFAGAVEDARIYDTALDAGQIAALAPNKLSDPKPLAWWSFEDGTATDRMGTFPVGKLVGGARIAGGKLLLDGRESYLVTPPAAVPGPPAVIPRYDSPIHYRPATDRLADTIPFFWKGDYHVFYLRATDKVPWEHIVSRDLVHWQELPTALEADGAPDGPDGQHMFTGSVTEKDGTFHIFYTGHNGRNPRGTEFICHATSPDLIKWTKHPEDILAPDGVLYKNETRRDFRDPYVFWNPRERRWWMVFFGQDARTGRGVQGLAVSEDLRRWTFQPPLEGAGGQECPDLFTIGDKWYLIGGDHYSVADAPRGPYRPAPVSGLIDRPNIYAAKRMTDGRRQLWTGWVWDIPGHRDGERNSWGGTQCLPRELYANADGQLYSKPAAEVVAVFTQTALTRDRVELDAPCSLEVPDHYLLECELRLDPGAEVTIAMRQQPGGSGAYRFMLDPQQSQARLAGPGFDYKRPCPVDVSKPIKFQAFVQGTIIECFVNDRYAQTCRAYNYQHGRLAFEVRGGRARIESLRVKLPAPAAARSN